MRIHTLLQDVVGHSSPLLRTTHGVSLVLHRPSATQALFAYDHYYPVLGTYTLGTLLTHTSPRSYYYHN